MALKKDIQYPGLETERLNLRILTLDETQLVYDHFSDIEITRFMDIEPCKDVKEAEEIINYHLQDAGCRWGIFVKSGNAFIGTIGFHYIRNDEGIVKAEVGYDLAKRYWGRGFMLESMKAAIAFGFSEMDVDIIDATVDANNEKSINLLKKLGFVRNPNLDKGNELYFFREGKYNTITAS
ncbi:hypothetical protein A8F94_00655 [Bacillus sp. FJAT-27225]|uniref:GNAT family N-acetyltransferase n=1 Tax=Bacillus sp. FJAT-27225 TaxID=1743144 RepID=UPI00080C336B|nr:GNAT family N-acetyltransferase [Bacillus sp. FJAT-27225]OCA90434.1 hypothetical protein A8F94_00655 [Bacillus sp. FJAT-27225]